MNIRKIFIIIGIFVILVLVFGFLSMGITRNVITGFLVKKASFENEHFETNSINEIVVSKINENKEE